MSFYVYILASQRNGTLYVGMTDDLARRIWIHRNGVLPGMTEKYCVKLLVWYEVHGIPKKRPFSANVRSRNGIGIWKLELIERMNPTWRDLYEDILL